MGKGNVQKKETKKTGVEGELQKIRHSLERFDTSVQNNLKKAEETKKEDVEKLKKVRQLNGYFYNEDNNPITPEEIDKRIESGNVAGIKTTNIYGERWTTKSKEEPEK